jgi:filamentous hemagglutinin
VNSTPAPVLVIRNGQIVLDASNSVTGSGIGVLASRDDTPVSDMDLFAPEGSIDAGDAGLRSTGNITLGARVILNANNIQAGGAISGAPAVVAASAPVAAVTNPTNNENKALEDAAPSAGKRDGAGGMLTVEVLDSEPAAAPTPTPAPLNEEERKRKARPRVAG